MKIKQLSEFDPATRTEVVGEIKKFFPWRGSDPHKWGLLANPIPTYISDDPWPVTFVGLNDSDSSVAATASIVSCDRKDLLRLSPWFAGFVVQEHLRGQGLGTEMLRFAEDYADAHGAKILWLDTERTSRTDQPEWYERRGWEFYSSRNLQEGIVMFKSLGA